MRDWIVTNLRRHCTPDSMCEAKVIKERNSFGTYFNLKVDDFVAGIDGRLSQLFRFIGQEFSGTPWAAQRHNSGNRLF